MFNNGLTKSDILRIHGNGTRENIVWDNLSTIVKTIVKTLSSTNYFGSVTACWTGKPLLAEVCCSKMSLLKFPIITISLLSDGNNNEKLTKRARNCDWCISTTCTWTNFVVFFCLKDIFAISKNYKKNGFCFVQIQAVIELRGLGSRMEYHFPWNWWTFSLA